MSGKGTNELPPGWNSCCLADICDLIRGVSFPKEAKLLTKCKGSIACLRTRNIQREVEWDDLWWIPSFYVKREEQIVLPHDVLISVSNSLELVGKVAQVSELVEPSTIGAFIAILRAVPSIDRRYVFHLLSSPFIQAGIHSLASTTTNIANVNSTKLLNLKVLLAPLCEQSRIADALDELLSDLDAGVAALVRVREKLKLFRASVLKAAVEGALTAEWRAQHSQAEPASELLKRVLIERRRHWEEEQLRKFKEKGQAPPKNWKAKYKEPVAPDTTNLPPLPEGWCWASVDQIGETQGGLQKSPERTPKENHYPYLRVANVHRGYLDLKELHRFELTDTELERLRLQNGDLLIVEGNGSHTEIGRCAIWRGEVDDCVHQNHIIRVRPLCGLVSTYINTFLNSPTGQNAIQWVASSTSGLYTLSVTKIEHLPIALMSIEEQEAIVEMVEDQVSIIDHLEADLGAKLKSAEALRQSILRHAFTGQLVPQDPNDEPASEFLKRITAEREQRIRDVATAKRATKTAKKSPAGRRGRKKKEVQR